MSDQVSPELKAKIEADAVNRYRAQNEGQPAQGRAPHANQNGGKRKNPLNTHQLANGRNPRSNQRRRGNNHQHFAAAAAAPKAPLVPFVPTPGQPPNLPIRNELLEDTVRVCVEDIQRLNATVSECESSVREIKEKFLGTGYKWDKAAVSEKILSPEDVVALHKSCAGAIRKHRDCAQVVANHCWNEPATFNAVIEKYRARTDINSLHSLRYAMESAGQANRYNASRLVRYLEDYKPGAALKPFVWEECPHGLNYDLAPVKTQVEKQEPKPTPAPVQATPAPEIDMELSPTAVQIETDLNDRDFETQMKQLEAGL